MKFSAEHGAYRWGERIGLVLAWGIASGLFFGVLSFTHRLPEGWSIFHVALALALVSGFGFLLSKYLYDYSW